jgi:hypothetical protein
MMDASWKSIIWRQFGAAIDMLENAIDRCPDELWEAPLLGEGVQELEFSQFWYIVYHTLFWLDLYLTGALEGFSPPEPFTLDELDPAGVLPERVYSKQELKTYLQYGREKCQGHITALTVEKAEEVCRFRWGEIPYVELLLYNLRHVQEHAAQLSLVLGQETGAEIEWVAFAKPEK